MLLLSRVSLVGPLLVHAPVVVVPTLIPPLMTVFPQLLLIQYSRQSMLRNIHTHLTQANKLPNGPQVLMSHCHVGLTTVMSTVKVDTFPTIFQCQAMEALNSISGHLSCSSDIFLSLVCHIFEQLLKGF